MKETKNLQDFCECILTCGGCTFNVVGGFAPHTGFAVAKVGQEETYNFDKSLLKAQIADYIQRHSESLSEHGNCLGGWVSNGQLYLDIVIVIQSKERAIREGIKNKQLAIYDLFNNEEIMMPKPQTTGTSWQRHTYMNQAIQRLAAA